MHPFNMAIGGIYRADFKKQEGSMASKPKMPHSILNLLLLLDHNIRMISTLGCMLIAFTLLQSS